MSESMKNQDIRPSLSFPAFQGEVASRKAGRKSLMLYPECCGEALSKERSEEAGREVFSSSGMAEYTSETRRVADATQRKLETQGITRYELNTKADLPSRFSR